MTDTAIEQRDEAIAEALVAGRSVRSVRREFGLSADDLDAALERLWPIDLSSRIRMIKADLGKLDQLTQVFYEKAISGCIQSGLLVIRVLERKHELLGMNSAARVEIIQAPQETPNEEFDEIFAAITEIANAPRGSDGDGASVSKGPG